MSEQQEKLHNLALNVLKLSRNTLLVNLRFLDMALSQFTYHEIEDGTLLTDGKYLLYDPKHILRCDRCRLRGYYAICCRWGEIR